MYHKAWLARQTDIEDIYSNWERSYLDLPRLLQTMQQFLPGMVVEKETLPMPPQTGHTNIGFRHVPLSFLEF